METQPTSQKTSGIHSAILVFCIINTVLLLLLFVVGKSVEQEFIFPEENTPAPLLSSQGAEDMTWPAPIKEITQHFHELHHPGIDIAAPQNAPVTAALAGKVKNVGCGWNGGLGCFVLLSHENGLETLYAHLAASTVVLDQEVKQGDEIAKVGQTGKSFGGPFLHFEVRSMDKPVDPLEFYPSIADERCVIGFCEEK